jgi:ribose-phosphate pyrophosphokinase
MSGSIALFTIDASRALTERVANELGTRLGAHEERDFEDGEHKVRPLESVRGRDVFLLASLYADKHWSVNDKLVRFLFLAAALRDASASTVTAVIPYLAYARKDRRTQPRDPVTTRYVAQLIEASGVERIVTLEVHNPAAYENAFRIPSEHLVPDHLFVSRIAALVGPDEPLAVISPDTGGIKRADRFLHALERVTGRDVTAGFMEKTRALGVMTAGRVVGDVAGRTAIIVDDMISTGGTLARCATACRNLGARRVLAVAAHGVFVTGANTALDDDALDRVIVTDSVAPYRLDADLLARKVELVPVAPLLAEAIRRIHEGGSLVELVTTRRDDPGGERLL